MARGAAPSTEAPNLPLSLQVSIEGVLTHLLKLIPHRVADGWDLAASDKLLCNADEHRLQANAARIAEELPDFDDQCPDYSLVLLWSPKTSLSIGVPDLQNARGVLPVIPGRCTVLIEDFRLVSPSCLAVAHLGYFE